MGIQHSIQHDFLCPMFLQKIRAILQIQMKNSIFLGFGEKNEQANLPNDTILIMFLPSSLEFLLVSWNKMGGVGV